VEDLKATAKKVYDQGVQHYQSLLVSRGCSKLDARKQARAAMARYLPSGLFTEIVVTMNARAARTIIEQRASPGADAEIRMFAKAVHTILANDSPQLFGDYTEILALDALGDGLTTPHRKI
jgi:thymidylate synthase ThyX